MSKTFTFSNGKSFRAERTSVHDALDKVCATSANNISGAIIASGVTISSGSIFAAGKIIAKAAITATCLTACLVGSSYTYAISAEHSDKSTLQVIKLTQVHFFFGDTITYVAPDAVRINNQGRMHFCMVARAPKWLVTVYRDDDKSCFSEPRERLENTGLMSDYVMHRQDRYVATDHAAVAVKSNDFTVKQNSDRSQYIAYLPLAKNASPEVESILFAAYKLPTNGGIPLKYIRSRSKVDWLSSIPVHSEASVYLNTTKMERVTVPRSFFDAPVGYRVRKSLQEAMVSDATRDETGDMVELFSIGKAGKSPVKSKDGKLGKE